MNVPTLSYGTAIAVPALTAAALYINGRNYISNDLEIFFSLVRTVAATRWKTVVDRLNLYYNLKKLASSKSHSNKPFLLYNGNSWTYSQAYNICLRYAKWLEDQGIKNGDIVAMDMMNSENFIWFWFALWSLGASPAFINYNLTNESLLHSIRTANAKLLIVESDVFKEMFTDNVRKVLSSQSPLGDNVNPINVVVFDDSLRQKIEALPQLHTPNEKRTCKSATGMAILIYTSGTTGRPKPAIVSWEKIHIGGTYLGLFLPFQNDEIIYTCMPLYHSSAAILGVCATLIAGVTVSLGHKFHRSQFWKDVRQTNATCIQYVGETCRYLLTCPPSSLDRQHKVRAAFGNGLRPDIWDRFRERYGIETICEFYASTEGPSALWNKSRNSFSAGAIGRAGRLAHLVYFIGISIVLLDFETNQPLRDPKTGFCIRAKANQPGELIYKLNSPIRHQRYQGYYNNPDASTRKIIRNVFRLGDVWYSTGDIVRDNDGRLYFCDRMGDTYRWKSENVSTTEVAEVLGQITDVEEANVYGVAIPNHDGRAGCVAIVLRESSANRPPTDEVLYELAQKARSSLPRYAVPIFLRWSRDMNSRTTGTNKQQKTTFRDEGVNPNIVEASGDVLYWLPPNVESYQPFSFEQWNDLASGNVHL